MKTFEKSGILAILVAVISMIFGLIMTLWRSIRSVSFRTPSWREYVVSLQR